MQRWLTQMRELNVVRLEKNIDEIARKMAVMALQTHFRCKIAVNGANRLTKVCTNNLLTKDCLD